MKPTEAQIKEFWEWCGFKIDRFDSTVFSTTYIYPGEARLVYTKPKLDLNNLFLYAMSGLKQDQYYKALRSIFLKTDDPALALFWAIYPLIKQP